MFADIDLRALADMTSSERAFLSVYLAKPSSVADLEKRFRKVRRVLSGKGEDSPSSAAEGQAPSAVRPALTPMPGTLAGTSPPFERIA